MRQSKKIISVILTTLLLVLSTGEVSAVSHIGECGATGYTVHCGALVAANVAIGSHVLYYTSNGTPVYCAKRAEKHLHNILCAGCGVVLQSNVVRNCVIIHQYCPSEKNVCKY